MLVVVLLHEHQDIVNVYLYLLDQLDLEDDVIRDVRALALFAFSPPFVPQVLILSKIILQVALGDLLFPGELVERLQKVPHLQDGSE